MQAERAPSNSDFWTIQDIRLGIGFLFIWVVLTLAISLLIPRLAPEADIGVLVSILEALLLIPIWWLVIRKHRASWRAVGLQGFKTGMLGLGCGLMILSFGFNAIYSALLAYFDLRMQVDLVPILANLSSPWWMLFGGVVVAPVVEEIYFRGFLFTSLRQHIGWRKAAATSAALFALIHMQPTAMIPIFILGYIFAYLYQRSHSIWPAVVMHISSNALALGAAYYLSHTPTP